MNNISKLIFVYLFVVTNSGLAQTPNWQWAKCFQTWNSEIFTYVTVDNSGFIYCTGITYEPIFFDSLFFNEGIVLIKFDSDGNAIWGTSPLGGNGFKSVVIDRDYNIYCSGSFQSNYIVFDQDTLYNGGTGMYPADFFIVKYDSVGNVIWCKGSGGLSQEGISEMVIDSSDNLYITGSFFNILSFDTTVLSMTGSYMDMFIAKFDSLGNYLWAKSAYGTIAETSNCIAIDSSSYLYVAGEFTGPYMKFEDDTLYNSGTYSDLFVAKYDMFGNVLWAKNSSGGGGRVQEIASDNSGYIYISGNFYADTVTLGSISLVNNGPLSGDTYIAKMDTSGNFIWAFNFGGITHTEINTISVIDNNGIIVSGYTYLNSQADPELFVQKYDTNGMLIWSKGADSGEGYLLSHAIDHSTGNIVVAGGTQYADSLTLGQYSFVNIGYSDIILAKLDLMSGIELNQQDINEVNLFPNPFTKEVQIRGTTNGGEYFVYNLLGNVIMKGNCSLETTILKTELLKPGYYLFKYKDSEKMKITKLVKL